MTNEHSFGTRRLSKFSNAGSARPLPSRAQQKSEPREVARSSEVPLADLVEHAIRSGALPVGSPPVLSDKLIEELSSYRGENGGKASIEIGGTERGLGRSEIASDFIEAKVISADASGDLPRAQSILEQGANSPIGILEGPHKKESPQLGKEGPSESGLQPAGSAAARNEAAAPGRSLEKNRGPFRRFMRSMRLREWERRRLGLLTLLHRYLFDRKTERLLFIETPNKPIYQVGEVRGEREKTFVYKGPIPSKVLEWALSALPSDLKRYAFVDFDAGNGRTLLLAARRNFEFAEGYSYDAESAEVLEMNLAQYPRSYMSCRDVRATRGDRNGIVIPAQPAVFFFSDSLDRKRLATLLADILSSYRLNPRPLYLIFDSAGREKGFDQIGAFHNVQFAFLERIKLWLFSPAKVAIYRSEFEESQR